MRPGAGLRQHVGVAVAAFALTVAAGFAWLPARSRAFWLGGVCYDQRRVGDPANPSDQSLAGAVARMAASDLYILVGLGVLAATRVALTRRRADAMKPDF